MSDQKSIYKVLKLSNLLRNNGYEKHADELEYKCLVLKKAETNLYSVIKETGQDLIDAAHPEGSHKLIGVEGDSTFETISDQKQKIQKIVEKQPNGKLSNKQILGMIKSAGKGEGLLKLFERSTSLVQDLISSTTSYFKKAKFSDILRKDLSTSDEAIVEAEKLVTDLSEANQAKLDRLSRSLSSLGSSMKMSSDEVFKLGTSLHDSINERALNQANLEMAQKAIKDLVDSIGSKQAKPFEEQKLSILQESVETYKKLSQDAQKQIDDVLELFKPEPGALEKVKRFFSSEPGKVLKRVITAPFRHYVITFAVSEVYGVTHGFVSWSKATQEKLSTINPRQLNESLERLIKQFDTWTVDHPAIGPIKNLSYLLKSIDIAAQGDFSKLKVEERTRIIEMLESIKENLSSPIGANITAVIPYVNFFIDINDTAALSAIAESLCLSINSLIAILTDMNQKIPEECVKLSKKIKLNIDLIKKTYPDSHALIDQLAREDLATKWSLNSMNIAGEMIKISSQRGTIVEP